MTADDAKDYALETCKSGLQMDLHEMKRGLEKWGFKITEYERLTEMDPRVLQEYLVWLKCDYGVELLSTNIENWLHSLPDFPWLGRWDYVIKYLQVHRVGLVPDPHGEYTISVTRWPYGVWSVSGLRKTPPWPNGRRHVIETTRWMRA